MELTCLKIVFNHFIKKDVIVKNPVSRVKFLQENNEIFVVLSESEEKRYLMACSQPLQDVAALIIDCGCRPDEIYQLKKQNVNLDGGYIRITDGKTKSARRTIPLSQRALAILRSRVANAKGEYLFLGGRTPELDKPVVKLNNAHTAAVKRAKLRNFRLYDCRHTFASRHAMNGTDLVTLKDLLGHSRL